MRKSIVLLLIGLATMGLFGFKKQERKSEFMSNKPLLGMILLSDTSSMKIKGVVEELRKKWKLQVDDKDASDEISILVIDGYNITIANLSVPIPGDEIEIAAKYNYFWENGVDEATKHKGHIILSILNAGKNLVKENILFNKVAASILENSNSLGVYVGGRSLLLKKEFYLANTEMMTNEDFPLFNWIYFGMRHKNERNSVYTYGLADFNKKEMEIVNSAHSLKELRELMFNLTHYVILSDVTLKAGETIGVTDDQKMKITESKGEYLDGKTLKIEY